MINYLSWITVGLLIGLTAINLFNVNGKIAVILNFVSAISGAITGGLMMYSASLSIYVFNGDAFLVSALVSIAFTMLLMLFIVDRHSGYRKIIQIK